MGVNVQLMVFNPEGEKGKGEEIVLVNPKILKYSNKHSLFTEGCLSFPGMEADVEVSYNLFPCIGIRWFESAIFFFSLKVIKLLLFLK